MCAQRNESVRLSLDDAGFTSGMAKAAVQTALLDKTLNDLDGTSVKTSKSLPSTTREVTSLGSAMRREGAEIDKFSGRLRLIAETASVLGPALIPIGALGVPAIAGLASGAGLAALAVGTLVGSLQGVGDAVSAVDAYQLDPTVANLEKAQQALDRLAPAAQEFVAAWDGFQPILTGIRDAGAEGWFPGLTESLDHIADIGPQIEDLFRGIGQAGGEALAKGTESLASERWEPFLDFLTAEGPAAVTTMSQILGDLAHAAAEMWQSFDPGNDAFLGFVAGVADGFDRWASSSDGREDIRAFLDYAATNGPKVQALFVALVDATAQIVQAAAPLAGPVLASLTAVAKVIGAIADSDIGTPLLAGVAALSAYNRVLAITGSLSKSALGQQMMPAGSLGIAAMAKDAKAGLPALSQLGTVAYRFGQSSKYASDETLKARGAIKAFANESKPLASTAGKAGAAVAGLALASSGAADDIGLTTTASLGLMGALAGPWGVAVGAGVGLAIDFKSAAGEASASVDEWTAALDANAANFAGQSGVLAQARADFDTFRDSVEITDNSVGSFFKNLTPGAVSNRFADLFGESNVEEEAAGLERLRDSMQRSQQAAASLGVAFGQTIAPLDGSSRSITQLQGVLDAAAPAMNSLGISAQELAGAQARSTVAGEGFYSSLFSILPTADQLNTKIVDQAAYMGSAAAKTDTLANAFQGLDLQGNAVIDTAGNLQNALDSLLAPELDVVAASDAWTTSLRTLGQDLGKNSKTLEGNSNAAIRNRAAISSRVQNLSSMLVAEAKAGAGSARLSQMLQRQRQSLIDAGVAAGMSEGQLRKYLIQLGLTPKIVKTLIEANTSAAESAIARIKREMASIPRSIRTDYYVNQINSISRRANVPTPGLPNSGAADGATIPGPRTPYGDKLLYMLAPGEEVISNRNGQADRHRGLLKAINGGLAAGGAVAVRGNTPVPNIKELTA